MSERPFDLQSRDEEILASIIDGTSYTEEAQSRIEYLLLELKEAIEGGGSSSDYATDINFSIDSSTFVITAQLKNKDGDPLGTAKTVDIPLESTVIGGSYNAQTKSLILTLVSGQSITIPIGDIISGLQAEITAQNPLDADLVSDTTSTHKFVTAAEKAQIATNTSDIADIQDTIGENTYIWYRGLISAIVNIPVRIDESTTRCYTPIENSTDGVSIVRVTTPDNMKCRVTFVDASGYMMNTKSHTTWTNQQIEAEVPQGAVVFGVCVAFQDNKEITVADCKDVKIIKDNNEYILSKEFCGEKISILGDSISTFGGSAADDPSQRISDGTYTYAGNRCRYPQSNLLTNVSDTYWMRLIKRFGLILGINESWAGSRVSWDGTTESGDIGANKHIASAARIGHLGENGTPDIILINAGTNDIGNNVPIGTFNTESPVNYTDEQIAALPVATFADAYRTMLIRLQKSYPTSKIVVLLPNFTSTYYTPTKADEYCEIIKEACDYFGIKWIDMRASGITMFNRGTYLPDGIHYNAQGMYLVERNVEKFFNYNFTIK